MSVFFVLPMFIALTVAPLVMVFVSWGFASASLYWLRRRGHPELWKAAVVAVGTVTAAGGACLLAWKLAQSSVPAQSSVLAGAVGIGAGLVAFFLAAVGAWLVTRHVPYRSVRIAGTRPRRHRYGWWAAVWLVAASMVLTLQWPAERIASTVGLSLLALRAYFVNWERRSRAPDLDAAAAADKRPPVLYLRSFAADDQAMLWRPRRYRGWAGWLAAAGRWLASYLAPQVQARYVTLEQYIQPEVTAWIGPLVALGNPEDRLAPEGAARAYLADTHWQADLVRHAQAASAVIVEPSSTAGLAWELQVMRERGLASKTFMIIEPRGTVPFALRAWTRLGWRMRGWQRSSWPEVATGLKTAGYVPPAADPGPGSVLTFDEQGRSLILASETRSPAELIRPVRRHVCPDAVEGPVTERRGHVFRETVLVLSALVVCSLAVTQVGHLLFPRPSVVSLSSSASITVKPTTSPAAPTSSYSREASQLAGIGELAQVSAQARREVVTATGTIQACASQAAIAQAVHELAQAADIRLILASKLTRQPVDLVPDGIQLASDLQAALLASARSDENYAAWGSDSLQNGTCTTIDPAYQRAQVADQTATTDKVDFADLWNQQAAKFGLPELNPGQF